MSVRIVTDSSAVLPGDLIERHRIEVVPLQIAWDDDVFSNGDLSYADFERRLGDTDSAPTTSAPSPGAYAQAFERVLADVDGILVVAPAEEMTATVQNARLAADTVGADRVRVFDSRSAAAGQGLVAIEAARAAADGDDIDTVSGRAERVSERVTLVATLERLDYLKRSGRVPGLAAKATGALDIHPIFRFQQGSPSPTGAARGAERAAGKVFDAWRETLPESDALGSVLVFHSSRAAEADRMQSRVEELRPGVDVHTVQITAAMAAHLGPGLLGLAWWWDA